MPGWYLKAAEQGNTYAQHNLGVIYCDGQPAVARDQLRRRQGFVVLLDVDPTNALTKEQTLDPMDDT